ncbi:hypothetical protein EJ08DRAFT_649019 [Tothia fuscella]|uniref:Uncharacterized protein n=1 Tax=Tothia fuscella TaxID=1048955 RepID=A0A9P4NTW2_9PEZI|nr:hypothetical protein EJ08DRAFT_649019 [Tothia fuscella]
MPGFSRDAYVWRDETICVRFLPCNLSEGELPSRKVKELKMCHIGRLSITVVLQCTIQLSLLLLHCVFACLSPAIPTTMVMHVEACSYATACFVSLSYVAIIL